MFVVQGKTSHCYRIAYRSPDRSMTDEEINLLQASQSALTFPIPNPPPPFSPLSSKAMLQFQPVISLSTAFIFLCQSYYREAEEVQQASSWARLISSCRIQRLCQCLGHQTRSARLLPIRSVQSRLFSMSRAF